MTDGSAVAGSRAAVIGAGRMGHGIALEAARGGFTVAIHDSQPGRPEAAIAEAEADAQDLVAAGLIRTSDIPTLIGRLLPATSIESAAAGAEVVFEAVAEDLDVKRHVFAQLDRAAPPTALLLSNTSSLAISDIAAACQRPERVALAHWILPPHLIPAVEVAPPGLGPRRPRRHRKRATVPESARRLRSTPAAPAAHRHVRRRGAAQPRGSPPAPAAWSPPHYR